MRGNCRPQGGDIDGLWSEVRLAMVKIGRLCKDPKGMWLMVGGPRVRVGMELEVRLAMMKVERSSCNWHQSS